MRITLSVVAVAALCGSASANLPIIGGTKTTVGQYPTVVAIEVGGGLCTGELIAKDWVLTAAHCVDPQVVQEPNQAAVTAAVVVVFDNVDIFKTGGHKVRASATMFDPQFNVNNLGSHDIGLIKLAEPVTDRMPTPVNFDASKSPIGTIVTQVGYGTVGDPQTSSAGVEYELKDRKVVSCNSIQGGFGLSDANLLCFSQTDGKGKCEGDSGGPTFAMVDGVMTIIGVTSFGDQNCQSFGADTRTDAEAAFVKANVQFDCETDADCGTGHECFSQSCIVTPFEPTGLGATCNSGTDCESGTCATGDGGKKCSETCTVAMAGTCPSGFECLDTGGGAGACWPSGNGGGCCDVEGKGAPTALLAMALCGLALGRRRRSRA